VSEWIAEAMEERLAKELRLDALADWLAEHEAEHGPITDAQVAERAQLDSEEAARRRAFIETSLKKVV